MRHRRVWMVVVLLASVHLGAEELTEAQLKEIVEKPHSPILRCEAFKIFPPGRTFDVVSHRTRADGAKHQAEYVGKEKWVDGKYIVDELPESNGKRYFSVISFDEKSQLFISYWFAVGEAPMKQVGKRTGTAREMVWTSTWTDKDGAFKMEGTMDNTDGKSSWHEVCKKNGALDYTSDGTATPGTRDFSLIQIDRTPKNGGKAARVFVAVSLDKADIFLKNKFAFYRNEKRILTLTPDHVELNHLVFVYDEAKDAAENISESDCIYLEDPQ